MNEQVSRYLSAQIKGLRGNRVLGNLNFTKKLRRNWIQIWSSKASPCLEKRKV